jgi:hypothetical protein
MVITKILKLCLLIQSTLTISFYFNLSSDSKKGSEINWVVNALETQSPFKNIENTTEDSHLPVIFIDSIGRQSQLVYLKPITLEQQGEVMIHFTEKDGEFENVEAFNPETVFLSYEYTKQNLESQGQEYLEEIVDYVEEEYKNAGVNMEPASVASYDSQYLIRKDFTNTDYSVYKTTFEEPAKVIHLDNQKTAVFIYLFNENELTEPIKTTEMMNNHNFIELFASDCPNSPGSIPGEGLSVYARMNNWVGNTVSFELPNGMNFSGEQHKDLIDEKSKKYITPAMICNDQFMCTEVIALRILHGENNLNNRTGIDWTKLEMTYHNLEESNLVSPMKKEEIESHADKEHILYVSQFNHLIGMTLVRMTDKLKEDYQTARTSPNRTSQNIKKDGKDKEDVPEMMKTLPEVYTRRNEFNLFLDNFRLRERELSLEKGERELSLHDMVMSIEDNPDFTMPSDYYFKKNNMIVIFVGYKEKFGESGQEEQHDDEILKRNLLIM